MANLFNSIPLRAPKLNKFNLSHDVSLTCEMGQLVPFFCEPVLPSDRFKVSSSHLVRFAPLQAPIMSNVDVYVHFFFVPNRIIWNNWETFITGSSNGKKLQEDEVPSPPFFDFHLFWNTKLGNTDSDITDNSVGYGSFAHYGNNKRAVLQNGNLADYLGFQTFSSSSLDVMTQKGNQIGNYLIDELPFRAYQRIWFDYFRDENLSDCSDYSDLFHNHDGLVSPVSADDVNTYSGLFSLRQRAWRKDYFTSSLPWAQKGDDVLIPGSSFSPDFLSLYRKDSSVGDIKTQYEISTSDVRSLNVVGANSSHSSTVPNSQPSGFLQVGGLNYSASLNLANFGISSDSNFTEGTIRELRRAFAAQAFLERRAVGGSRYNEQILSFFGVKTSDGRLQRAEFLGGSKQPVVVSQVLQTSESTESSPLGEPAGTAVSAGGKYIFDRQFEEYGFVIGLISVMPKADYLMGIPRKYNKRDVYDYYWPQFARIGEQEIRNDELYWNPMQDSAHPELYNDAPFGYAPRYSEYRFINNSIHGDFKDSLSFWNLGRSFADTPKLNEQFITCRPRTDIFSYEGQDFSHLWVSIHVNCSALRPMPKYAESL